MSALAVALLASPPGGATIIADPVAAQSWSAIKAMYK